MAVIEAVVTEDARKFLVQYWGALATFYPINYFKVGEGGWINQGIGPVQRAPVDNLRRIAPPAAQATQDLDAIVDGDRDANALTTRYPADSRSSFQKALIGADFTFIAPSTLRVRCKLGFTDYNNDGFGNSPEIWEIGLFSDHPLYGGQKLMVAYGTLTAGQVKTGAVELENYVKITAG